MKNLFRIDFVLADTTAEGHGQVAHALVDYANDRKVINLSLSADKLTSVSNYTREPRRLEFECLADDWINENLLSGTMEFGRYVSKFEVRAYRDGTLLFTGFPDTSLLALDHATQIIKITCYDRIKLLSMFSDLEFSYNFPQGYLPWWIVGYFMQGIQLQMPVPAQILHPFTLPVLHQNDLTICRLDYTDQEQLPPASGSIGNINGWRRYRFDETSWHYPRYGWILDTCTGLATFVFAHKKVLVCEGGNGYAAYSCRAKFRARVWRFFNNLCPVISEYDEKTSWVSSLNDLEDANDDFAAFFTGLLLDVDNLDLVQCGPLNGNAYNSSHWHVPAVADGCGVTGGFAGNIFPARLFPGKEYENTLNGIGDEPLEHLKTLQAMLLLYNATVYCDAAGRIVFRNKDDFSSTVTAIPDTAVVAFSVKRSNQEEPDMSVLEALCGDTTLLATLVKPTLRDFYAGKWLAEMTIDGLDAFDLQLFGRVAVHGKNYAIIELQRDFAADEYKIKAWEL